MIERYRHIIFASLLGLLYCDYQEEATGWSYVQSNVQTFYFFMDYMAINTFIDENGDGVWSSDEALELFEGYGDGSLPLDSEGDSECFANIGACDVIGAFMSHEISEAACDAAGGYYSENICDVCVGWNYYNSSGNIYLAVMGFTQSDSGDYDYYPLGGEIVRLKLYDASSDTIYPLISENELGPTYDNLIFSYYPDCTGVSNCPSSFTNEITFYIFELDFNDLDNQDSNVPESFSLTSVYPNPFNPSTQITYNLSSIELISVKVLDAVGNEISTLFTGYKSIGTHELTWIPESWLSSGQYFIQISSPENTAILKATYIK